MSAPPNAHETDAQTPSWHDELRRPGSALLCGAGTWCPRWQAGKPAPHGLWCPQWQAGTPAPHGGDALLLPAPERILEARNLADVAPLLAEIEAATRRGHLVVGYLTYEAGAAFELTTRPPPRALPLAWAALYEPGGVRLLTAADLRPPAVFPDLSEACVSLNVDREAYGAAIDAVKRYIAAGDTYQVNYTCRARFALAADPLSYFLTLVASHPVPYAAYLNLGPVQVLSLSPELFLRRRGDVLESHPMKGTRRRGRTLAEDRELAEELVASEKDRAENLMIVDMVRNDLGRIAHTGTVTVPRLFVAERYRSVWQMTSTVVGRLRPEVGLAQVMAATFPGASITGAPKRRTMEIIHELEPEPRGIYTGAIGLFMPDGDFTCGLPIRTLVHCAGHYELGIGAGILWDSQPQAEYEETLLKAQFALRVTPDLKLFETLLLATEGEYADQEAHLARMAQSAEYWAIPFCRESARRCLDQTATEAASRPAVVRLELDSAGELTGSVRPAPPPPPRPVRVVLSAHHTDAHDRLLVHKTNRRALYDEERTHAQAQGFWEVLFANHDGHVTEGAITNVFLKVRGQWVTPPVTDGLLPGIWRESFLREVGAKAVSLTVADLQNAEEVVIGNSVRGAIRVDEVCVGGDGTES